MKVLQAQAAILRSKLSHERLGRDEAVVRADSEKQVRTAAVVLLAASDSRADACMNVMGPIDIDPWSHCWPTGYRSADHS